ncbi:FAD-dependent oxidoreductase [Fervidicoccus fontis]|jgi:sulfide:quinone oxidoreductase|uniref:FAD-dependent pyridine nucleotide-disulfide oxidoreductase n=2 Tax=Fervidicoccus fontis TaxID=683846 RepID=I0A0U3_FERFK|nr:FAD-dependent oxidoreductase [Fervidicoccus fontis]AFH42600.1 FAD-dependent pyridine nucleotide-disulfide oxidoreductase [Fervidicoccus fontis Kam940]MBE9391208.1 FAD-dependent oxidoreductase [Fervidicoccus fontis]
MSEKRGIVIIGGGAGGIITANILAEKGKDVTLISDSNIHPFQPGYLFIAFKGHEPSKYIRTVEELLDPRVKFIQDKVTEVDLKERSIKTEKGKSISYEKVVVATGASLNYDLIPGHRENYEKMGDYYSTPEAAVKVWNNIKDMKKGKLVIGVPDLVIKCPPAPHKGTFLSAGYFKEKRADVRVELLYPAPHVYGEKEVSKAIEEKMKEFGNIDYRTSFLIDSIDNEKKVVRSATGEEVSFDALIMIPMHKGTNIKFNPPEVLDDDRYVKVHKNYLNIEGYDDAFAVGDCTNLPTSKSGVTAHLGAFAIAKRILGEESYFTGRTNCPCITDDEGLFVISDYDHHAVPVRFTRFKRLLEDVFIVMYWASLRYPLKYESIFDTYFKATEPSVLGERGW